MAGILVDVTPLLLGAQHLDTNIRAQAEQQLKAFQEQNFPGFITSLATELANNAKAADSRRLAGILLKNNLDAKEEGRRKEMHARWIALDGTMKQHIREALLSTLASESIDVRHTAAMALAKVAAIDLPRKDWPTLIQALLNNMAAQPPVMGIRQATLETMGFVCEEIADVDEEVLTPQEINMILTAVVAGMGPTEPDETRLSATLALSNAIEFAKHNFENETERNYLMQVVCQGTQSPEIRIRTASFECLHEIAALYYTKLVPYMSEIYNISVKAMSSDHEDVALQAIEFWNTVCEEEYDRLEEQDPSDPCLSFMKAASPHLVPILLELMLKQEEGQEQDDTTWNVSIAAGTCLGLTARVIQDDIVPMAMPFVTTNISKNTAPEDWRLREASTFAFGLILDGPSPSVFSGTVQQALGYLLQAMKDPNGHVKDTTAWTIGRIFEFLHSNDIEPAIVTPETLPQIMTVLLECLKDESHVAYRVCCAISYLAMGFHGKEGTSPMSPYFNGTIAALLQCAQRHANHEHSKVQISAFEAINDLVRAASRETLDVVAQLIMVVLPEIYRTFDMPAMSAEAREKQAEVQGQLCGVLQVIIQKLSEEDDTKPAVVQYADQIMETLIRIFSNQSATVHEEAMLAVGSFSYAVGKQFTKYLPTFVQYLKTGLTNYQEWQVCLSTVGVLGDICRNVEEDILPFCDDIMFILVSNLGREDVHRTIKPSILSAFGDIALVVGAKFDKYLDAVLRVLKQAMQLSIMSASSKDVEYVEYNNQLRQGIFDSYSGIIQGLGPALCAQYLASEVAPLIEFVSSVGMNMSSPDDDVMKAAINLLGDLCSCVPGMGSALQQSPVKEWSQVLMYCKQQPALQESCDWAVQQVEHVLRQ